MLFWTELLLKFFTSYKDRESDSEIFSLQKIAVNFIWRGGFWSLVIPALPFVQIFGNLSNVIKPNVLQDLLCFKLVRLVRIGFGNFIPEQAILRIARRFSKDLSRQERISKEQILSNFIKVFTQLVLVMVTAYFFGLLWYRFSDKWQQLIMPLDN